jgi:hypothetical protein
MTAQSMASEGTCGQVKDFLTNQLKLPFFTQINFWQFVQTKLQDRAELCDIDLKCRTVKPQNVPIT